MHKITAWNSLVRPQGLLVFLLTGLSFLSIVAQKDETIPGFVRLLDRGKIASIDNPILVPAAEAEIADESWVMGVEIEGDVRAYSLNLLNSHEVVNDVVSNQPIAAVW